jgi:hypothetical protein
MIDFKVIQKAEELMKKANLPEMVEIQGKKRPSLDSWLRETQPKPKK